MADRDNRLRPYASVLAVRDLATSCDYFRDALGFTIGWQEADDWRMLERGDIRLMLGHCPNERSASDVGDHSYIAYWHVDDVDALHTELTRRGALIRHPPIDRPWGQREMLLATPDGHRFVIGQTIARSQA